jgi:molybdate transport system substrate-binding protein
MRPVLVGILLLPALMIAFGTARAETLRVLTTGAFKEVVLALVPGFESRTGHKVEVGNDTAGALARRIGEGEAFDLVVLTPGGLKPLEAAGKVVPGTTTPLGRVAIGVAVRSGSPVPRISTTEEFKAAVLAAGKVAFIDPAAGGSSGIYLDGLFTRLGIADAVKAKAVLVPGGLVATRLVSGEADLAIHQISEILPVAGVQLVGPLPEEVQNYTTYAGAIGGASQQKPIAQDFLAVLAGPEAARVLQAKGMTRPD